MYLLKNKKEEASIKHQHGTEKFFKDIFNTEKIYFRCINNGNTTDPKGHYNKNIKDKLDQLNSQNYEIYFVVNGGGYKDKDIKNINAVFLDLDCGRDDNNEYYPLQVTEKYKKSKIEELGCFSIKPSYIVETRNGLHVYWLLKNNADSALFEECENKLIGYFDGDLKVKNLARLMRVPDTYWCKDVQNKHLTTIISQQGVRYDINELINSLPFVEVFGSEGVSDKKKLNTLLSINDTLCNPNIQKNIQLIKEQNLDVLHAILKPKGVKVNVHKEVYDYIKKQNLRNLLGVGDQSFQCIFHNDNSPSAGIVINEETGHHIYNCHSTKCGLSLNTIQVVQRLTHMDIYSTLNYLRKVYKIEYNETVWKKERIEILKENDRVIWSKMFKEEYPEISKIIGRYIPSLSTLIDFAIEKITTDTFTDNKGSPIFFASNTFLAKKFGKADSRRISNVINVLVFIGLLEKVKEENLPDHVLKKAKHEAAKKKQKNIINFYTIPSYTEVTLQFSKRKAKEFKEKGFTMKGWSRELLYRSLGEKEADRVYPQSRGKPLSELSEKFSSEAEKIILNLIGQKDWTTMNEIFMQIQADEDNRYKDIEVKVKRILTEVIEKYGLIKKKLNKAMKQEYNIELNGYPFIIIKENEDKKRGNSGELP